MKMVERKEKWEEAFKIILDMATSSKERIYRPCVENSCITRPMCHNRHELDKATLCEDYSIYLKKIRKRNESSDLAQQILDNISRSVKRFKLTGNIYS